MRQGPAIDLVPAIRPLEQIYREAGLQRRDKQGCEWWEIGNRSGSCRTAASRPAACASPIAPCGVVRRVCPVSDAATPRLFAVWDD